MNPDDQSIYMTARDQTANLIDSERFWISAPGLHRAAAQTAEEGEMV